MNLKSSFKMIGLQPAVSLGKAGAQSPPGRLLPAISLRGLGAAAGRARSEGDVFDKKSAVIGLVIFAVVVLVGFMWTLKPNLASLRLLEKDFEFSVAAPKVEDVPRIREPIRDVLREPTSDEPPDNAEMIETIEMPNIQISTAPVVVRDPQVVIKSSNLGIDTPKIDVTCTELEIPEAPAEISVVSETPT